MRTKLSAIALACALLLLAACAPQGAGEGEAQNAQWLAEARLDAHETPEELYQLALAEDTLLVYSNTTRMLEVKKSFEARYPGLVVEVTDMRGGDILSAVSERHAMGEALCDLIVCTDELGIMAHELIPGGALHKYVPYDIADHLLPQCKAETLVFLQEAQVAFYNTQAYAAPPITNWWELTEPRFEGKVYMENPLKSDTVTAFLCAFLQSADALASAYQDLYGEALEIPEGSDAGKEYIRRLMQNGLVLVNSNAEVAEAVGRPGQENPHVGIMISSRIRNNELGYHLAPLWEMEPYAGTYAPNSIMMVAGAESVSAAKLFVRWLLGEAGGTGEGIKPYQTGGTWPVRSDVPGDSSMPSLDASVLMPDRGFIYENRAAFEAYWNSLLGEVEPW